jgi:beta-lactamase class A
MPKKDNKIGGIKGSTLANYERENVSFVKKMSSRKAVNWSVIIVFFFALFVILFLSLFPVFSVRFRVHSSSFDKPLDKKIIDDFYAMDLENRKPLPFGDQVVEATDLISLGNIISREIEKVSGEYGIYVKDIKSGETININDNHRFTAASLTKLYVAGAYYKRLQDDPGFFSDQLVIENQDKIEGNGDISGSPPGSKFYSSEIVKSMLNQSDNTAFAAMVRELGMNYVEEYIKEIGASDANFINNTDTPQDIGMFFDKLYGGTLIGDEFKDEMISDLQNTVCEDRLPFYLPGSAKVVHKIGTWDGAYSDAGIVYSQNKDYIIVVMTDGANYEEAVNTIRKISQVVYNYFNK